LVGLNREEADFGRRMLMAMLSGGIIGYERRLAGQSAGIRTMTLVSLGAAIFAICSVYGFQGGNMEWDSSRVAAAIPTGVGFLGAGVIYRGMSNGQSAAEGNDSERQGHRVHGLTTAVAIWLSAAVGLTAGGGLYFNSLFTACFVVMIMRLMPQRMDPHSPLF
jgi:uncharacterized membrane protein YhiD involved in acid resistance